MSKVRALITGFLFFLAFAAGAQDLPELTKSSRIVTGSFPNGVSYYFVANNTFKGYANFAIVQKGADYQEAMREGLGVLPHFGGRPAYRFLSSRGVGYGADGYVKYAGDAAIYNFENVPTFDSAASDSALVLITDLAARHNGKQAVVVCGDIDTGKMKDKLYMLSLTVGKRGAGYPAEEYEWIPSGYPNVIHYGNRTSNLAEISVSYASPRTLDKYMNTPQPLVSQMYARLLGYVIRKRTEEAFARKGLALGYTGFEYLDSSQTPGDERYAFSVGVESSRLAEATAIVSSMLAGLDGEGASQDEFSDAKSRFLAFAEKSAVSSVSNSDLAGKCISNYLYGANLADNATISGFFKGRKMDPAQDLQLFNRFVSALLDPSRNLTLSYSTPADSLDAGSLQDVFQQSWAPSGEERIPYRVMAGDTLALYYPMGKKVKLKTDVAEPLTGGRLWSFSNGMKVVFRKTDDARIRYALMIRGGYGEVPGVKAGESAFVGDMLMLCNVAGMSPERFRNMLEANGISMDCKVSLADMRISGTATRNKLGLVLRSLLSIQKDRSIDRDAFAYYRKCEALRQEAFRFTTKGVNAVTDSIMCPDFFYPSLKIMDRLGDDLPEKAGRYFDAQFAKNDDGVLFIEGDIDSFDLQKILFRTLGSFRTGGGVSVRPKVAFPLRSGWATYTVDKNSSTVGDGGYGTNIAISALRPFTMQNWCAFRISVEALRRLLVEELATMGQQIEIVPQLQLLPVERVSVFINCRPCPSEGLPSGVEPEDPLTVMSALRAALTKLSTARIPASELKGLKASLSNDMASEAADSDYIMEAYLRRNSEGKDMVSNYKTYLDKVSVEDVEAVLTALENGSKVEYVIK